MCMMFAEETSINLHLWLMPALFIRVLAWFREFILFILFPGGTVLP